MTLPFRAAAAFLVLALALGALPASAQVKWSNLAAASAANATDLVAMSQGCTGTPPTATCSASRAVTGAQLQTFVLNGVSIHFAMPAEFIVSGSPVNGTGTVTVTRATQSANLVMAGPTSGAAAIPTFRSLVGLDHSATNNTHGIVLDEGASSAFTSTAALGAGQLLVGQSSADPAPETVGGDCTMDSTAAFTCFATPATVAKGGTGRSTLPIHGFLIGETTRAVNITAAPTAGQVMVGQSSADPAPETVSGDCTLAATGAITCTKTSGSAFAAVATSGSAADLGTGTLPAARLGGMSQITNAIGSNVSLNNTGNFFDGPSIAQGTSGVWLAIGSVVVTDTGVSASISCKLWDGTTVLQLAAVTTPAASSNVPISLVGVITSPAANLKVSCQDATATTGRINAGGGATSVITAIRIG